MSRLTGSEAKGLMEAYDAVYASQEVSQELQEEVVENDIEQDLTEAPIRYSTGPTAADLQRQRQTTPKAAPQNLKGLSIGPGGFNIGGKPVQPGMSPIFQRPGVPTPTARPGVPTPTARPGQTVAAAGGAGGKVTVGKQYAATLGGQKGNVTYDAAGKKTFTPTTTPKAAPSATPAKPAAPQGTIKDGSAAGKPAATPAAPQRTFNPLMQRTFGYQTGNAPSQIAAASQGTSQATSDAAFKKSRETVNKMRSTPTLSQSFDLFDIVKGHLLDEGYAETEEAAIAIMANMSEEWKQSIVEADSIEAMRARAAKRRQQRYKGGPGGRDDFRPYTKDDYDNPKPGYGSGEAKKDA